MNSEEVYITNDFEETRELGEKFAKTLNGGEVLAMYGELGGGKTTFVQGLALGLGIERRIISPTFIIMRTYDLKDKTFYHIDLYRTSSIKDIEGLGIDEIMGKANNILAIEWAEKMKEVLPDRRIDIFFKYLEDNKREIKIVKYE